MGFRPEFNSQILLCRRENQENQERTKRFRVSSGYYIKEQLLLVNEINK